MKDLRVSKGGLSWIWCEICHGPTGWKNLKKIFWRREDRYEERREDRYVDNQEEDLESSVDVDKEDGGFQR